MRPDAEVALAEIAADVPNAIAAGPFGSNLVSRDYVESGVPVIRGQNLSGRWVSGEFVFVSEAKAQQLRANTARPGDIVFTQRGTLGQVAMVPSSPFPSYVVSQSQMKLTVDESRADPRFIYYACSASDFVAQVHNNAVAAGVPHINLGVLRSLRVPLPSISHQVQAADMLAGIDDRIDLLRQTNATLESIAQALFKSWFIDFDPVRAKAEGREPEGMDAATAALFPAEFEESALGMIPKGWTVTTIAQLCTRVANGGTPSRNVPEFWKAGSVPWFKTGELSDGLLLRPSELITPRAVTDTNVKVLQRHAVLMAIYAAPTVGRLGVLLDEAAFNQACTGMVARVEIGAWFLFQTLRHGRDWFNSRANGAAQQNISKAIVESYECVRPTSEVLGAFGDLASNLYASAERNLKQAQILAEIRDSLLPRLLSGRLRLPEAEEAVLG